MMCVVFHLLHSFCIVKSNLFKETTKQMCVFMCVGYIFLLFDCAMFSASVAFQWYIFLLV